MSDWKESTLGAVSEVQTGPFGSQLHMADYARAGTPIITVEHLGENNVLHQNLPLVSNQDRDRLKKYLLRAGDIVFSRVGSVDRRAYISEREDGWMFSGRLLRVRALPDIVCARYLSYYFGLESFREYIRMVAVGATMPSINTTILSEAPLVFPPLAEQQAIAEVLSSLDDKIDLLHRQNETLEQLAETLFRQWFVEGEEVIGEEEPLERYFDFLEGPGLRHWQYTLSGVKFINIRLIDNGEIKTATANYVSEDDAYGRYKHFLLQEKDMVVSTSGTLGKTAIVRSYHLPMMLNTSVIRFRPKDGISYPFLYQYLQSKSFIDHLEATASGSVQANFGPTHLKQMRVAFPAKKEIAAYCNRTQAFYEKLSQNYLQIKNLQTIRDTLLPKLMSGIIRIKQ
jgi:type I restriction enzyme S subunit